MSLRETLEAAAAPRDEAVIEGSAVVVASEPVVEAAPPTEPVTPELGTEAAAAAAPPEGRDEKGRFAPKEPKAPEAQPAPAALAKPETAAPVEAGAQDEPTRIPPSLSAAVKAQWSELPKEVREDISKLEGSVQTAKAEWGRKGERLNRYDEIMAPRAEKFALQGIDEFTAIKTLLAAQDFLERDPLGGIQHLARSYGVNLQQLTPQAAGQGPNGHEAAPQAPHAPDLNAALAPLMQQVQALQTEIQTSKQSAEAAEIDRLTAEIAAFSNDPANLYFHNVEDQIVTLIQSKMATGLKDAYEKAIWADPAIRPLLLKAQSTDQVKRAADDAARKKADQSRQAAGSVTGSPSAGAQAPRPGSTGNLREDLRASFQEHGASV